LGNTHLSGKFLGDHLRLPQRDLTKDFLEGLWKNQQTQVAGHSIQEGVVSKNKPARSWLGGHNLQRCSAKTVFFYTTNRVWVEYPFCGRCTSTGETSRPSEAMPMRGQTSNVEESRCSTNQASDTTGTPSARLRQYTERTGMW